MLALLRSNYCNHCCTINLSFCRAITTSELKEYYAILNVNRNSTSKEIKESFLKLSKVYHPDNKQTGSHSKFVKLKEAYDAIKEGSPTVTSSTYSNSQSSHYNRTANSQNMNRSAHEFYRERQRQYESRYNDPGNFGYTYSRSTSSWEEIRKAQRNMRPEHDGFRFKKLAQSTIIFGAIAWIFIYSGVLLIWEHNQKIKSELFSYKPRTHADYVAYESYLRRKERDKLLRVQSFSQQPRATVEVNDLSKEEKPKDVMNKSNEEDSNMIIDEALPVGKVD